MKKLLCLAVAFAFFYPLHAQKPGAVIDVQHYDFSITINDSNDVIKGSAGISVAILKETPVVTLDLISKKNNGKGMTVTAVTEKGKALSFQHADDIITVQLAAAARPGEKRNIVIDYEGIPADGLIISHNKYRQRVFFADNWPNRARNWIPCVDHPADKASVNFSITAPVHYQVVANGVQVEETSVGKTMKQTRYEETVPLATKVMTVGAAQFAVQLAGQVECIPVYSWVYPEDRQKGFYDYALAAEILPWFIKRVGPYAYKKLANVQSKTIFGGLENANTIFYHEESSVSGTRRSESLLAHEIAHQWFGNMATESDWPHLWLSEGFATYMTILYFEEKYGRDTALAMLREDRDQVIEFTKRKLRPVVDTAVTNYMDLLNANSYQKGGWVLHMLRHQLGDDVFWKGIRAYYAKYAGKNASSDDLRKVLEQASGKNLEQFFRQWLYTAGVPELDIKWQYESTKRAVNLVITQKQPNVFQFPLEIAVRSNSGVQKRTVQIKDKQTALSIPVSSRPLEVIADPDVKLLFAGVLLQTGQARP